MNNANEYRAAMDGIRFSDGQKAAMTAALSHAAASARHRVSVLRPVLIAAVVCVLLVGSALAVTALHSAGKIGPFGVGDRKEQGYHNPGYTVTYDVKPFPLSVFSDRIREDAAQQSAFGSDNASGFDSWEKAEQYVGFDLMNNSYLARAEKHLTSRVPEDGTRAHVCVIRLENEGVLDLVGTTACYYVTENGIPVRIDLEAVAYTEAYPVDGALRWDILFQEEEPDLFLFDITGSNGLTAGVAADPDEAYPTYYSAHFAANGIQFTVHVQYDGGKTTASHEEGNAAAKTVLQAVIDGFTF